MNREQSDWESSKAIAKGILRDRTMRRRWIGRWLLITLVWMAVGLWGIEAWLAEEAVRFLLWWGACGVLAVGLMIFALYDSVSVVREERGGKE